MSTKAKVKIFTGIAVLLAIVVAAVAYCGRERQIPADIGCFPHIKRICVGGEYFTFDEDTRRGAAPAEGEILGTISSVQETHARLTEDGSANFDELLGQPYALRDGKLLVRRPQQLERPIKNADGTWSSEKYYIWYACAPEADRILLDGVRYICVNRNYSGTEPTEEEFAGTLGGCTLYWADIDDDGYSNFGESIGQPYVFRDGKLLVRAKFGKTNDESCTDFGWYEFEPEVDRILVDGVTYIWDRTIYRGEADYHAAQNKIKDFVPYGSELTQNATSNFVYCVGQPYFMKEGRLIIRRKDYNTGGIEDWVWYECKPESELQNEEKIVTENLSARQQAEIIETYLAPIGPEIYVEFSSPDELTDNSLLSLGMWNAYHHISGKNDNNSFYAFAGMPEAGEIIRDGNYPAEEMEPAVMRYFDVTAEQMRGDGTYYDARNGTYHTVPPWCFGEEAVPYPIKIEQQGDIVTITCGIVWSGIQHGTTAEEFFTNIGKRTDFPSDDVRIVTLRLEDDGGFKYLSNVCPEE